MFAIATAQQGEGNASWMLHISNESAQRLSRSKQYEALKSVADRLSSQVSGIS